MTRIRGLIFDLDGTLADTLATIGNAVNFALEQVGLAPHPLDEYRTMVGEGVVVLCERALGEKYQGRLEELLAAVRRRYATHLMDGTRAYEGIPEVLGELRRQDLKMAVLSNKPHDLTRDTIEGLGMTPLFTTVLGQQDDLPRKPDPAAVHLILEEWGLKRNEVLFVGDTPTDMKTARAAGLRAVGVTWGFRGADELRAAGADVLIDHPRELLSLL